MWTAEQKCLLWLDSFPLEPTKKHSLLKTAGGAVALVRNFSALAKEFKNGELFSQMLETLSGEAYFAGLANRLEREKITPVFYGGEGYPKAWLTLADAPLCLYAKGELSLLKDELFAVVGSRRTLDSARKLGGKIAEELTARFAVLTGSADGGDETALRGALDGGKAVCLLAGGFGFAPKENPLLVRVEKEGLLLSACPLDTPVRVFSYEYRNKLLAAMSVGVLVLGAAEKSGALITAKYAATMGKKLFAIPYAPSVLAGTGCNQLIKNGAYLTETANDILEKYGYEGVEKKKIPLTETEEKAVEFITERGEAHVSEISSALNIPTYRLATMLSALEVKGAVVKLGGNRYSVV